MHRTHGPAGIAGAAVAAGAAEARAARASLRRGIELMELEGAGGIEGARGKTTVIQQPQDMLRK